MHSRHIDHKLHLKLSYLLSVFYIHHKPNFHKDPMRNDRMNKEITKENRQQFPFV